MPRHAIAPEKYINPAHPPANIKQHALSWHRDYYPSYSLGSKGYNIPAVQSQTQLVSSIRLAESTAIPPTNGYFLSHPPERRRLELGKLIRNPQRQSRFFVKLPPEVRELVYLQLLGGRRVHVDHVFRRPTSVPLNRGYTKAKANKGKPDLCWQWWHRVCEQEGPLVDDRYWDRCSSWANEATDAREPGWAGHPPGAKISAVQWLQCCQIGYEEAQPILYRTNTFVTGPGLDTPFHMSRLLLPEYTALITSMDISIEMTMPYTAPPDLPGNWATVYPAFLALFDSSFSHVRHLCLTLALKPWRLSKVTVTDESLDAFFAPWEALAISREWKQLDLCVPQDWYERLKTKATAQGVWSLRVTEWGTCVSLPCHKA